jgi:hypothetical protein
MADLDRQLASSFAIDKWSKTFASIGDDSETLVAGMLRWALVTTYKENAERTYYMVTGAGLHVGQLEGKGGMFGGKKGVDYFLPRDSIVGSDSDHQGVVDFHLADGTKVILVFDDIFPQHAEHQMQQKPAAEQAATVGAALGWPSSP